MFVTRKFKAKGNRSDIGRAEINVHIVHSLGKFSVRFDFDGIFGSELRLEADRHHPDPLDLVGGVRLEAPRPFEAIQVINEPHILVMEEVLPADDMLGKSIAGEFDKFFLGRLDLKLA